MGNNKVDVLIMVEKLHKYKKSDKGRKIVIYNFDIEERIHANFTHWFHIQH